MAALLANWHFFLFVWAHCHHMADLRGWLRTEYPGMPGAWYGQYARNLVRAYGTGRDLLVAVRPY